VKPKNLLKMAGCGIQEPDGERFENSRERSEIELVARVILIVAECYLPS